MTTISVKDREENYGSPPVLKPVSPCNSSVTWDSADDNEGAEPPELLPCAELPRNRGKGYFGKFWMISFFILFGDMCGGVV